MGSTVLSISALRTSPGGADVHDVTVAVAPTDTVLSDVISCLHTEALGVVLTNTDGSQELNAWIEVAPTINGPWDRSPWTGLEQIAAGETRYETASVKGRRFARLVGTASGAGLNVRTWIDRVNG